MSSTNIGFIVSLAAFFDIPYHNFIAKLLVTSSQNFPLPFPRSCCTKEIMPVGFSSKICEFLTFQSSFSHLNICKYVVEVIVVKFKWRICPDMNLFVSKCQWKVLVYTWPNKNFVFFRRHLSSGLFQISVLFVLWLIGDEY